jgi:hypothetical protein
MGEAAAVYAESLARYNHGHPLWWPEPTKTLGGKVREVEIGDVGYVDGDGAFIALFNVTYEASHERNAGVAPPSFRPLAFDRNSVIVKEHFFTTCPLFSASVKSQEINTHLVTYADHINLNDE